MTILFWPFMIASIVFSLIAIAQKKPLFLVVSFVLIIPFSLYLAAMPTFKWWGLFVPLCYLCAALALRKNIIWLTFLLILPVILSSPTRRPHLISVTGKVQLFRWG